LYGAGINFTDIAFLKWENIKQGRVEYVRAKTGKQIDFKILPPVQEILDYWKPLTFKSNDDYVFNILNKEIHKTPVQIDNRIHKVIQSINKGLKEIGKLANVEIPITTYVARHTFATLLKNSDVSSRVIGEMMGHKDEKITETYLKKFDKQILDDAMGKLL
jgi:integrase